jgi:hypothetical protein
MNLCYVRRFSTGSDVAARTLAATALLFLLMLPVAYAADPGTIVGVVTDAAGRPVADARVTAVKFRRSRHSAHGIRSGRHAAAG